MELAERYLESMKHTAGSRFNAARRLERRDRSLATMAALTSAYIIGLTILPYFLHLPPPWPDRLNLLTVVFSIIVLVSSLLQSSKRDGLNSEQHHRCALEINEIRRAFANQLSSLTDKGCAVTDTLLDDFASKYNAVLQKYSINHDDEDYYKYQIDHLEDYSWMTGWMRTKRRVLILASAYLVRSFTVMITISFVSLACWACVMSNR